jgi:opacity protein-like surface antigen
MKKSLAPKLAALAGIAALSASSVNAADSGVYTKLDAGVSFINKTDGVSFNTGFATNGLVGFNLNEHFGLELEGGYAVNSVKGLSALEVSAWSGFSNLVLRSNFGESISAFVGGGPGFAHVSADAYGYNFGSETVFAGQAKTGITFKVSEQISVDLTYRARFMDLSGVNSSVVNQQITGGISIGF